MPLTRFRRRPPAAAGLRMTLVVGAYEMKRELPRTVESWSRRYQREIEDVDYDIVIVDNGSSEPVDETALRGIAPNLSVRRVEAASPSPAAAINEAVRRSTAPFVGLVIDGARMASPGLLHHAAAALRLSPGGVVGSYGFHLGPDLQHKAIEAGYDRAEEDRLLASVPWRENGYRLFDISVFAGSSKGGWFRPVAESNAVFLSRALWNELGGLDERFVSPGGGYVNIDFWQRALEAVDEPPWMLLGEGTFHQLHGGAATNAVAPDVRPAMRAEFERIRGRPWGLVKYAPRLIGPAPPLSTLAPGRVRDQASRP